MKLSIKIFLLLLFVVAAVGAVLIFVKTQVAPPGNVRYHDQYSGPLNETLASVGEKEFPDNTDNFRKAYHKISFMNVEELLTDEQTDNLITRVDTIYGGSMVSYAYNIFNSPIWEEEKLGLVANTMDYLRADLLSDGGHAVTDAMDRKFSEVENIVSSYREALAFSRDKAYRGVNDASQRINKIDDYRNKPYLSNNVALMEALDKLPDAINASHYAYLESQINRLGGYKNYNQDTYNNSVQTSVLQAITDYDNASFYGSGKRSMSNLYQRAVDLIAEAQTYYQRMDAERIDYEREQIINNSEYDEDYRRMNENNSSSEHGFIL